MADLPRTTAYPMGLLWNDTMAPGLAIRPGASTPALAAFQGGVFQSRYDKGNEGHGSVQVPHSWAPGSELHFHVHWTILTGAVAGETIVFGLEWFYAGIGQTWVAGDTVANTEAAGTVILAGTENNKHMLTEFTAINPANFGISGIAVFRIYRKNAGTSAANPFILSVDAHFQQANFGTSSELGPV